MVSNLRTFLFFCKTSEHICYITNMCLSGQPEGGREESVPQAVRGARVRPGGDQAILPRRGQRAQDVLRQQVRGAEEPPARTLALHPDHGRAHQELRLLPDEAGLPRQHGGECGGGVGPGGSLHTPGHWRAQGHRQGGGGQRPQDPQDADLQAVRGGQLDRTPPGGQEEEARHQVQECKLVTKVQRNFPLVSVQLSIIIIIP